jgi:hypothetical protein
MGGTGGETAWTSERRSATSSTRPLDSNAPRVSGEIVMSERVYNRASDHGARAARRELPLKGKSEPEIRMVRRLDLPRLGAVSGVEEYEPEQDVEGQ